MKKFIISSVLLFCLLTISVLATIGYIYSSSKSFLENNKISTEIFIEKGQSYSQLYQELFKNMEVPKSLDIYLRKVVKLPQNIKFGYYVADNITYREFISNIMSGIQSTVKVTIPEGFNLFDISNALDKAGVVDKDEFLNLVFNKEYIKKVTGEEHNSLEGFLFPGTYKFPKKYKSSGVVDTMYGNFKKNLPVNFKEKVTNYNLSVYEAIILASIVQKETYNILEAPVVASVYYNRLKINMILQADPTILYGKFLRGDFEIKISKKDLRDETNIYNTYKHKGLPVTPICNPSLIALESVANPAKTSYLYFVASKNGEHLFSETYDTHRRYVNEHQKR